MESFPRRVGFLFHASFASLYFLEINDLGEVRARCRLVGLWVPGNEKADVLAGLGVAFDPDDLCGAGNSCQCYNGIADASCCLLTA
jgi:hypothetical protein